MKRYIILFCASIFAFGCTENLELNPLNQASVDTYFTSVSDFELFVNTTYQWSVPDNGEYALDYGTEFNAVTRGDQSFSDVADGSYGDGSGAVGRYFNYSSIRHAYEYFTAMEKYIAGGGTISEDKKKQLDGEVYYMLAYRYFSMFRAYESVPIVRGVLTIEEADINSSPKEEVFAEALAHIEKAIANLPAELSERGRLTKLAALTLKADMLLYTASRWEEALPGATFATALEAANAALTEADAQGKELSNDYHGLFLASKQPSAESQKEIILEYVRLPEVATSGMSNTAFRPTSAGGYSIFLATQLLVDRYECTDGLPINVSAEYDASRPYKNRDPRLGATVLTPGSLIEFVDGGQPTRVFNSLNPDPGNGYDYILSPSRDGTASGYIMVKYWDREQEVNGYGGLITYRYADLLLMAAEAENEATGPSSTVYSRISELRNRVGMPDVDASTHPTKEKLRALIRNERVVELAGEGKHYWDLRRWGIAEEVMNTDINSLNVKAFNADGTFANYVEQIYVRSDVEDETSEELWTIPHYEGGRVIISYSFSAPKNYVWPIPAGALSKSNNLEQHPLWE